MEFGDNFVRRINDKNYQIALAKFVEQLCREESKDIEKRCKRNPFLKNRIKKAQENIENMSNEDFAEAISDIINENAKRISDKVEEFSKKWDKEHYKVIYKNFNQENS